MIAGFFVLLLSDILRSEKGTPKLIEGICHLCKKNSKLCRAHIIPECFYELAKHENLPLLELGVLPKGNTKTNRRGFYDCQILCEKCDNSLGNFDGEAKTTLLLGAKSKVIDTNGELTFCYERAKPEIITKFVMSMIWRASISTLPFFSSVKIGPYKDKIRDAIFSDDWTKFESCIAVFEYDFDDAPIFKPVMTRFENINFIVFQAARFRFVVKLDQREMPSVFRAATLSSNNQVISIVEKWLESENLKSSLKAVKASNRPRLPRR
jgi:hypothetical protein